MTTTVLSRVPQVRDDQDLPFVVGASEGSPSLAFGAFELRRGPATCYLSAPLSDGLCLNTVLQSEQGAAYVTVSTGPFLVEWWPIITAGRPIPGCPLLTRIGATGRFQVRIEGLDIPAAALLFPDPMSVVLSAAVSGGLDDDAVTFAAFVSPALCRVALEMLGEYRTLVRVVPDVNVQLGPYSVPLEDLLVGAAEVAQQLPGEVRP
ncbi:MAG TPA: hypothetical protein DCQ04_10705 [Actinobacteria bacterium]|jgi:hypothetical protein|nr:hypothetical protein [Actinomycetota bacterium]